MRDHASRGPGVEHGDIDQPTPRGTLAMSIFTRLVTIATVAGALAAPGVASADPVGSASTVLGTPT